MKKIVFFGTYNPGYPRNRLLLRWTRSVAQVVEINEQGRGLGKYIRLIQSLNKQTEYDAVVVGFPGHVACIIARLFSAQPIIFDAFISLYDTYVFDRASVKEGSLKAWYYWCIDWLAFHMASVVVADTDEHADYIKQQFGLSRDSVRVVPVVTDIERFVPASKTSSAKKIIWWHGKYSRLHNVQYIIAMATLMQGEKNIEFHLLGSGGDARALQREVKNAGLSTVVFLPMVPYEQLAGYVQTADIGLGLFGTSDKVDRVVPNKIYEYLACGKPVVTKRSHATERICEGLPIRYVTESPEEGVRAIHELLQMPVDPLQLHARVRSWYADAEQQWKALL